MGSKVSKTKTRGTRPTAREQGRTVDNRAISPPVQAREPSSRETTGGKTVRREATSRETSSGETGNVLDREPTKELVGVGQTRHASRGETGRKTSERSVAELDVADCSKERGDRVSSEREERQRKARQAVRMD